MANYQISPETQSKGGTNRALALSPRRRREIARTAARARWANEKKRNRKKRV
jgi:hypothetical protein